MLLFKQRCPGAVHKSDIVRDLLATRGITTDNERDDFLHPSFSQLHDPMLMSGMTATLKILYTAKDEKWPVVVYGDYDADGVCSTVLLSDALQKFGIAADTHTPMRSEGYGLNKPALLELSKTYRLLITVDLGITNYEEVLYAKSLGMTVIVTDHHGLPVKGRECPADAVLSPLLGEYPFRWLCGTGVAYKLAQALLGNAERYLDLVAVATVADLVSLTGENRVLASLGLRAINERKRRGLNALIMVSGCTGTVNAETVAFQIAPRINAAGRIGDASLAVRLLLSEDENEAKCLAEELNNCNNSRKQKETLLIRQVEEALSHHNFTKDKLLLVHGTGWDTGLVGLAAGKLTQEYHCPCGVLSEDPETGRMTGSFRSIKGIHIYECLKTCDDLLLHYGGHELAAGATVASVNFDEFYQRMQQAVKNCDEHCFIPTQEYDLPIQLSECTFDLVEELRQMEPFGTDNPHPLFYTENLHVDTARLCGANEQHLQMDLRNGSTRLKAIGFNMKKKVPPPNSSIDAVFFPEIDTYRGQNSVQMKLADIRVCRKDELEALRKTDCLKSQERLIARLRSANGTKSKHDSTIQYTQKDDMINRLNTCSFGQLILCTLPKTAAALLELICADLCESDSINPQCFNTLLLSPDPNAATGFWTDIWLADGEAFSGEAAMWHQRFPEASVHVLPQEEALNTAAREILTVGNVPLSRSEFKKIWTVIVRQSGFSFASLAATCDLTVPQTKLCLSVLKQCGLIEFTEMPLRITPLQGKKADLESSPLLQAIRALAEETIS